MKGEHIKKIPPNPATSGGQSHENLFIHVLVYWFVLPPNRLRCTRRFSQAVHGDARHLHDIAMLLCYYGKWMYIHPGEATNDGGHTAPTHEQLTSARRKTQRPLQWAQPQRDQQEDQDPKVQAVRMHMPAFRKVGGRGGGVKKRVSRRGSFDLRAGGAGPFFREFGGASWREAKAPGLLFRLAGRLRTSLIKWITTIGNGEIASPQIGHSPLKTSLWGLSKGPCDKWSMRAPDQHQPKEPTKQRETQRDQNRPQSARESTNIATPETCEDDHHQSSTESKSLQGTIKRLANMVGYSEQRRKKLNNKPSSVFHDRSASYSRMRSLSQDIARVSAKREVAKRAMKES